MNFKHYRAESIVKDGQLELVKIGKRSSGITSVSIHAMIERNKTCR